MELLCVPTDGSILNGFSCELTGTGTFGSLELVDDGQGGTFYVNNSLSGGEVILNTLFILLIIIVITKIIVDFFMPPRIRIKRST